MTDTRIDPAPPADAGDGAGRRPARPRRRGAGRRSRGQRWAPYLLITPFFLLLAIFTVLPIVYAVWRSLYRSVRSGLGLEAPREVLVGLANYTRILQDPELWPATGRTLLFGAISLPVGLLAAMMLALVLDSSLMRGRAFFRIAIFLPYAVPGTIATLLWGYMYSRDLSPFNELLTTVGLPRQDFLGASYVLPAMANIALWGGTGYTMVVLYATLQAVPKELFEAAVLDGCSEWDIARYIKLPIIAPAVILMSLFGIVGTLQLFSEPFLLRGLTNNISSTYTPNMMAYTYAFGNNNYSGAAALAVIMALVGTVASFGFLRLVRRYSGV